jgi:hypothetical protein
MNVERPQSSRRDDLLTMLFGAWLVIGVFVDGWAHNNDKPESFFTPWHGLFYSGFTACAAWMCWQVVRNQRKGARGLAAVPVGYGLGLLGIAIFAAGGVGDLVWHQIFGIEVDLEALVSPSHLTLFIGGLLVISSPLRAAWSARGRSAPTFGELLPALLSAALTTAQVAFFTMHFSPWLTNAAQHEPYLFIERELDPRFADWLVEEVQLEGLAAILLTTLVLMVPALLLLRRWHLPFGSLTLLFGSVSTLSAAIESFDTGTTFLAGVVGGLVGDLLVRRLRPSPARPAAVRIFALATPMALWLTYFGLLGLEFSVGWPVELWAGATVLAGLASAAASLVTAPPAVPGEGPGASELVLAGPAHRDQVGVASSRANIERGTTLSRR